MCRRKQKDAGQYEDCYYDCPFEAEHDGDLVGVVVSLSYHSVFEQGVKAET